MKKAIILLAILFFISAIYPQTFKEFFANNSTNGNLDSKFYSIVRYGYNDNLILSLSKQNLTDLEGLNSIKVNNIVISKFPRLRLYANHNNLTVLPENLGELTNLAILDLSKNNLTSLPEAFDSLANLWDLNLNNNNLNSLSENFGTLTNLWSLNLSNNNLSSLPESFGLLTNLSKLSLRNNNLTFLPQAFSTLTNLSILDLSNNKITSLPNAITNFIKLDYLNLNNNPLVKMPLNFLKKPHLKYYLKDTPLGSALYSSKLTNTNISDNKLKPHLVSSFYHYNYENEKPKLSGFKAFFALKLIKNIDSLFKTKATKLGTYNPTTKMTLPRTTIKEQFNKQRANKYEIKETESVEYQLPQEIIRNIYNYL